MRLADASGRKRFMGVLRGMEGTQLKIEADSGIVLLELDDVDRAKLVPDL
jgi:ribosome maturation factor RimP